MKHVGQQLTVSLASKRTSGRLKGYMYMPEEVNNLFAGEFISRQIQDSICFYEFPPGNTIEKSATDKERDFDYASVDRVAFSLPECLYVVFNY